MTEARRRDTAKGPNFPLKTRFWAGHTFIFMKNVLLLPGWMESLKLYENDGFFEIRLGKLNEEDFSADYVVGLSLGALVVLQNTERIKGKIILINPLVPKRNIIAWFLKWVSYLVKEGLFFERQRFTKNPIRLLSETIKCVRLLGADFSKVLDNFPKERLIIIRGKNDRFFCDQRAVKFLLSKNIMPIEVDGGHNWGKEIEQKVRGLSGR